MSKELIRLSDCFMKFDDDVILDHINLYINDKEFLTLLGPSGCGKTTTLRIIGGFQKPTSGDVYFDGVRINSIPPHKRAVNTVFQRYALFPHLNVFENIAFGLRCKKMMNTYENDKGERYTKKEKLSKKEIAEKVKKALALVDLEGFEKRAVSTLAGGQQQRVAIARALATKPAIILADEPTGNLDSKTSQDVLALMKVTSEKFGQTIVMITHNEELAQMADRIVHIEDGRIVKAGDRYAG